MPDASEAGWAVGATARRPSMRMSSNRPACAHQSPAGSILQRKPRMSSTSSGSSPLRIVPAASFAASSMVRALITGPYVSAESASWDVVAALNARKRSVETRDQLTPQEEQIARLARDGLSNPEIGAQL